jgi:phosphatidylserine decarboxylase
MSLRRLLLTALPKVALSRATGLACALPLPRRWRRPLFGWFARRYGADLREAVGEPEDYRSFRAFFRRPLRPDARPVAATPLVWPCDGRIVTAGPLQGGRVPQVKGRDYELADLLGDRELAAALRNGSQATIYLAPGDYHRVHAPCALAIDRVTALRGTLFPVNPPAVACIDRLFVRNSRHVFHCRAGAVLAAVVMVGAYNVGDTAITVGGGPVGKGEELGQFGFGSTVVVVVGPGGPAFAEMPPGTAVRCAGAVSVPPAAARS